MKLVGENFSRNGHNTLKGTVKAVDNEGNPLGWADVVNLYSRREKLALVNNLVEDLAIAIDDARRMVNLLHQGLEREALAAEGLGLPDEDDGKQSQATTLVTLAADAELWHTPDGDAFATIDMDGHRETWALRTKAFRDWLSYLFFQGEGKSPGGQAVQDALSVLSGKALFQGLEHRVFTRVAEVGGVIYLDLADDLWEVVRIAPDG